MSFTELYRRRGSHIAIATYNQDGTHTLVNNPTRCYPTKATWRKFGPMHPGHLYAALQAFRDGPKPTYEVVRRSDLTELGFDLNAAMDLSRLLYEHATSTQLHGLDDLWYLTVARDLLLITTEELETQRARLTSDAVSAPTDVHTM